MSWCDILMNVNVNVRHTYWAPLNPVTEALHAVELTLFLWHMSEGVVEHSFLGCSHQSTCMPSYSLYVQLLWYPMHYSGGRKAGVSPVQWSEPHSILTPTQDSNPGGRFRIMSSDHYTTTAQWLMTWHCDDDVTSGVTFDIVGLGKLSLGKLSPGLGLTYVFAKETSELENFWEIPSPSWRPTDSSYFIQ